MRSSIILTAAFAATAFSTPMKRDLIVETDTAVDIDYVTDIVTVTEGAQAAATTPAAAVTTTVAAAANWGHWGHHSWHKSSSAAAVTSSSSEAAPAPAPSSYSAPAAPAPAPSSSSEAAPAPAPSSYSAPAAPAPAPSSSSEAAPAPSSYSAPAPSSSTVATSTSAAPAATATTYQEAVVNHHNYHRTNHSAPAITWDANMASLAGEIANSCVYAHDMTKGTYGQNIAAGPQSSDVSHIISDLFYNNEVEFFNGLYGQQDPDMSNFESWGHFSQVVWKGTTGVGCASNECPGGLFKPDGSSIPAFGVNTDGTPSHTFTVCNYSPPGNVQGNWAGNIGSPIKQAVVSGTANIPSGGVTGNGY